VRIARREPISEVRGIPRTEANGHESGALDSYVASTRQVRLDQCDRSAGRRNRKNPSASFVRCDQVTGELTERSRRNCYPTLDRRVVFRNCGHLSRTADSEHDRPSITPCSNKQSMPEAAHHVKSDSVGLDGDWQIGETSSSTMSVDLDDARPLARLDGKDLVSTE
jgi:hypothetical protein